jgi:hypothetical protein
MIFIQTKPLLKGKALFVRANSSVIFDVVLPPFQNGSKVLRQFAVELYEFLRSRVYEAQSFCVQALSRHDFEAVFYESSIFGKDRSF